MRKNLLALGLILFLVALLSRHQPPQPPKIEWESSFWLQEPNGFGSEWLDFENNSYKICGSGCTSAQVFERGHVERKGYHLELTSEKGDRHSYELVERNGRRYLQDEKGVKFDEVQPTVHRLHPERSWFASGQTFELEGVTPGMTRAQVLQMFPQANLDATGEMTFYPHQESPYERVTIGMDGADRVQIIHGIRLSQQSRPLLNERSTRRDVECLLGRLFWIAEKPDSFGTTEKARCGGLEIKVHALVGMTKDESSLIDLSLTR